MISGTDIYILVSASIIVLLMSVVIKLSCFKRVEAGKYTQLPENILY